ncbi:protease modulator HflC [Agaribacter marinus]|uniref:Protein HflC n=1 Tax=Agaribacter marinus TaxID=1431249 RepID=A0AA37WH28_9ALTE|nr:protease modulator HflC [Agaribacter marinus]GLR69483.1 protein HflC [Agaribacter marinus]
MKRIVWGILFSVIGIYFAITSVVAVKETEIVVVSQFGRPVSIIQDAGPAFKLPDPIQTVKRLDKRLQMFQILPAEYGTLDQRNLVVDVFVVWKIIEPMSYLASVRNNEIAEQRLETLTNAEVGAAIGSLPLNDIFTVGQDQNKVEQTFDHITDSANEIALRELGIEVVSIRPNRLGFPKQNLLAIYKRMESEWDKLARQYRAEGQEEAAKIRAETELEIRNLKAVAYRDAQNVKGRSEAEAARLYADAFELNQAYYKFTRKLDAYDKIINEDSQLILSSDTEIFDSLFTPPEAQK